jgi:undecaprenyl-diphosphatase
MSLWQVIVLAIIQGLAELLPVSSSAHVVVAEELMGLNPTAPEMTLLLVMLHTGTMIAVIVYFWRQWRRTYFRSWPDFWKIVLQLIAATFATLVIGGGIIEFIEKVLMRHTPHAQIEMLFGRLDLIGRALAAVGVLILIAGLRQKPSRPVAEEEADATGLNYPQAWVIGVVQGLAVPFRGFSRSGSTISAGMLLGVAKSRAEEFSFALAVILTPPAVAREVWRLAKAQHISGVGNLASAVGPSLLGGLFALLAGLVALKWLSRWLESGRWWWFGVYCLAAAGAVEYLHHIGY